VKFPTDLGTWGFILSIVALALMYPVGVLINMTTPLIANWIAARTKKSLEKRIVKLEGELAEFEKTEPITEVESEILWGIRSLKIFLVSVTSMIALIFYWGIRSISDVKSAGLGNFSVVVVSILIANLIWQTLLRYEHDFRYFRSPKNRENLRKSIQELKKIRDSWGTPS
jgi:hypothetical protein